MTSESATSVLQKRRDTEEETAESDDGESPLDVSSMSDAEKAKLRKELVVGLVVGQWLAPVVIWAVVSSQGGARYRYYFDEVYPLTILCNGVLVVAVGYLVQGRIEHWHIRPTILWVLLPLLHELCKHEPFLFSVFLAIIPIPFLVVFGVWCRRYGVRDTCRLCYQYLQSCFEGPYFRRLEILTKRYIYDLDALRPADCDTETEEETETKVTRPFEESLSAEDLARIRANAAKHVRPYIAFMAFLIVWSVGWVFHQTAMVLPSYGPGPELPGPPVVNGVYRSRRTRPPALLRED